MSVLKGLGGGAGYLKCGFLGFAGSGKTYTATALAIGLRGALGLKGAVAMFDTEGGAQYVAPMVKAGTGLELVGQQSRALADCLAFLRECESSGVAVAIIDSATHIWREVSESYLREVNEGRAKRNLPPRTRMEFQDWAVIKAAWAKLTDLYLNSRLHVIVCGRAGYEWDFQRIDEDDPDSKKELVKTGIKMKAEGEFGYEPSLLVEMERVQFDATTKTLHKAITHRATVLKDRFGDLDGKSINDPTYAFFGPHVGRLVPGAHVAVDTSRATPMGVDEQGNAEYVRSRREREILCEKIEAEMVSAYPGQGATDKKAKLEILSAAFGSKSWTEVTGMDAQRLQGGLAVIPQIVRVIRAGQQSAAEAEGKPEPATDPEAKRKGKTEKAATR